MQPTQLFSLVNFHQLSPADRLELLLRQRERLFERQRHLLIQQTELEQHQQDLLTRRTVHEMRCRLFWLQLRNAVLAARQEQAETPLTSERFPLLNMPPEFTRGDSVPQAQEIKEIAATLPHMAVPARPT